MIFTSVTAIIAIASASSASAEIRWPHFHVNKAFLAKGEKRKLKGRLKLFSSSKQRCADGE
jgi:hypothetical protein